MTKSSAFQCALYALTVQSATYQEMINSTKSFVSSMTDGFTHQ